MDRYDTRVARPGPARPDRDLVMALRNTPHPTTWTKMLKGCLQVGCCHADLGTWVAPDRRWRCMGVQLYLDGF